MQLFERMDRRLNDIILYVTATILDQDNQLNPGLLRPDAFISEPLVLLATDVSN
jgi:hypothetical protein